MATSKERDMEQLKGNFPKNTPPIVSPQEWETARQQLLVKEKTLTRARDALAAERRWMPWMAVEKSYEFDGPQGKVSLLDLFESRRQLIVYRGFFEPGVFGWPEHACRRCSLGADQVAHLAHLNARNTTLAYASRAPQKDIKRLKERMGWKMPWHTITDSFDSDFGVDEWHGHCPGTATQFAISVMPGSPTTHPNPVQSRETAPMRLAMCSFSATRS
jgi:predicted dithiol-disulfide oxidoreductase (DUF899 family)